MVALRFAILSRATLDARSPATAVIARAQRARARLAGRDHARVGCQASFEAGDCLGGSG